MCVYVAGINTMPKSNLKRKRFAFAYQLYFIKTRTWGRSFGQTPWRYYLLTCPLEPASSGSLHTSLTQPSPQPTEGPVHRRPSCINLQWRKRPIGQCDEGSSSVDGFLSWVILLWIRLTNPKQHINHGSSLLSLKHLRGTAHALHCLRWGTYFSGCRIQKDGASFWYSFRRRTCKTCTKALTIL